MKTRPMPGMRVRVLPDAPVHLDWLRDQDTEGVIISTKLEKRGGYCWCLFQNRFYVRLPDEVLVEMKVETDG